MPRGCAGAAARVGIAFPSVVKQGIVRTAANIDHAWIGTDGAALAARALGRPALFLNDADAAGVAEMRWGAGRDCNGTVIMVTLGTGIGTALFADGRLVPEHRARPSGAARHGCGEVGLGAGAHGWRGLDFPAWIARVNEYLARLHALFWPDLFILGGAVSERFAEFAPLLHSHAQLRPAQFAGQAGVIGARAGGGRRLRRKGAPVSSKLPDVGTTIFTVMSRRARELDALNLGQGFPDYDIDPRLAELVAAAMRAGHNQYAPMEGLPALRERIAAKLRASYGVRVDPESEVTVTLGATEAIYSAIQAVVGAGR